MMPRQIAMNEFKFSCPHCQQHLQCDEQFSGREIQCPSCNHLIRIPPAPGKTAQFTPESGKTWATFVSSGNAPAPEGLSVIRKEPPSDSKTK
jgi:hypothetical protein